MDRFLNYKLLRTPEQIVYCSFVHARGDAKVTTRPVDSRKKREKKIRESTGQAVTRARRAGINTDKAQHLKNGLRSVRRINISLAGWN